MKVCDRQALKKFLKKKLDEDGRLDFFYHLDECPTCWEEVYNAEKAKHPEYYKKTTKRSKVLEKELRRLERVADEQDEMSEVA
jgi:hypothetical protein